MDHGALLNKDKGKRVLLEQVMRCGGLSGGSGTREGSGPTGRLGMVSSGWMEALRVDGILGWYLSVKEKT